MLVFLKDIIIEIMISAIKIKISQLLNILMKKVSRQD